MILLDTHALYWWVNRTPEKLSKRQIDTIETADTLAISAIMCCASWKNSGMIKSVWVDLAFSNVFATAVEKNERLTFNAKR